MDISFHAFQLQDGCDPENILPPKHEPDIVLTDVSSISRIRQQITRWTKEQKPVLVFGLAGSNQHETLPQLRVRNGMIFCQKFSSMLSLTKAFCAPFQVQDPGVTILTNSGSLGILGSDLCETEGLYQTIPDPGILQHLQMLLSRHVPLYNPILFPPQTNWKTVQKILSSMLASKRTANLLLLLAPIGAAWKELSKAPEWLINTVKKSQIPVHLCLASPVRDRQVKTFLQAGLPCHNSPQCAIQSIRILFDFYSQNSKNIF